jgi:hypothetical protein
VQSKVLCCSHTLHRRLLVLREYFNLHAPFIIFIQKYIIDPRPTHP